MSASEDEPINFPGLQALENDEAWEEVQYIVDQLSEKHPDEDLTEVYDEFRDAGDLLNYIENQLVPDESDMAMTLEEVQRLWDYFQDVQEHSQVVENECQYRRDEDLRREAVLTQYDQSEDDAWIRFHEEEYVEE